MFRLIKWFLYGISGLTVLVGLLLYINRCPSDEKMIKNFNQHRPEFERLVQMLREEGKPVFVTSRMSDHEVTRAGLTKERVRQYEDLLSTLQLSHAHQTKHINEYVFIAYSSGFAGSSGGSKCYWYQETSPSPLRESLDDFKLQSNQQYGEAFRKIDGNWYLFVDYLM